MMKIKCLMALLFMIPFPALSADSGVSLADAVRAGIRLDHQHRNRLLDVRITDLEREKARMNKRFYLDVNGSYIFRSQQMEIQLPGGGMPGLPGPPETVIKAGAKHNYDLAFSLVQPIYSGGRLNNSIELESHKLLQAEEKARVRAIEVAGMVKATFFTHRLLQNKKNSLLLLHRQLELHLERVRLFYDEQLAGQQDMLETAIKVEEIRLKLEDLEQQLKETETDFTVLCGMAVGDIRDEQNEPGEGHDEDEAASLAFFRAHHPLLKAMDQGTRGLELQKKILSGRYLPRVMGFAELHYARPGIDFFKNRWSLYGQGGIRVELALFDWNRLGKDRQITDYLIQQADNRKAELVREVGRNLTRLYTHKNTLVRQLRRVDSLVDLAGRDAALKQELYDERQAPNIDLLTALLDRERYGSMREELLTQIRLITLNIHTLIGHCPECGSTQNQEGAPQ